MKPDSRSTPHLPVLGTGTTVAHLLFAGRPALSPATMVRGLAAALGPGAVARSQSDGATLDAAGLRIVLHWTTDRAGPYPGCLTIAVGPGPEGQASANAARLARGLVEAQAERHGPATILWASSEAPVLTPEAAGRLAACVDDFDLPALPSLSALRAARTGQVPGVLARLDAMGGEGEDDRLSRRMRRIGPGLSALARMLPTQALARAF